MFFLFNVLSSSSEFTEIGNKREKYLLFSNNIFTGKVFFCIFGELLLYVSLLLEHTYYHKTEHKEEIGTIMFWSQLALLFLVIVALLLLNSHINKKIIKVNLVESDD